MSDHIDDLYTAAGVDTDSLEHKVRQRWNKSAYIIRSQFIERITDNKSYQFKRWDQLPEHIRRAVLRSIKTRQKRRMNSDKHKD